MAQGGIRVNVRNQVTLDNASLQRTIRQIESGLRRSVSIDGRQIESVSRPLGKITGQADEFTKSLEASNARVIAFGASVAIINGVSQAFSQLVENTIRVEKTLADINVVLGGTTKELNQFKDAIFETAKNTAQSFDIVAEGALEFARQGLSMEESIKRINDALILTRLTGIDVTSAVEGLTAAVNAFAKEGLSTTEIINKLSAVDVAFAVSSEDLINSLSRASSVANDAGVSFDELISITAALQETTARGGAVIGNALKSIFTRIQRPATLSSLQELGVAVQDLEGNILPATKLLEGLAGKVDQLSDLQRSQIFGEVAGLFQINQLIAAVTDLGSANSRTAKAIQVSASATDEAYRKNDQLNTTLSALLSQTGTGVEQLFSRIGEIGLTDDLKTIIGGFSSVIEFLNKALSEDEGNKIAKGFVKGIGGALTSAPFIGLLTAIIAKLSFSFVEFGVKGLKSFLGLNKAAEQQKVLQQSILQILLKEPAVLDNLLNKNLSRVSQEKVIFELLKQQELQYQKIANLAKTITPGLYRAGARTKERGVTVPTSAGGYMPAVNKENRDIAMGVGGAKSSDKSVLIPNFSFGRGKKGPMVANTGEYIVPNYAMGGDAIFNRDMVDKMGMPKGAIKINAAGGYIPNFAAAIKTFYVKQTEKSKASASKTKKPGDVEVKFPVFGVNENLKGKTSEDLSNEFTDLFSNEAMVLASKIGDPIIKDPIKEEISKFLNQGSVKSAAGSVFEAAVGFILDNNLEKINSDTGLTDFQEFSSRSSSSLMDFTANSLTRLRKSNFDIFNIGTNELTKGADAKVNSQDRNMKSVAEKIFKILNLGYEPFQYVLRGKDQEDFESLKKDVISEVGPSSSGNRRAKKAEILLKSDKYKNKSKLFKDKVNASYNTEKNSKKPTNKLNKKASNKQGNIYEYGAIVNEKTSQINRSALGYIPNFAQSPLEDAIAREQAAGVPINQIRVNQNGKLRNSQNPMGLAVTNTRDEPTGAIPNFANRDQYRDPKTGRFAKDPNKGSQKDNGSQKDLSDNFDKLTSKLFAVSLAAEALSSSFSESDSVLGEFISSSTSAISKFGTYAIALEILTKNSKVAAFLEKQVQARKKITESQEIQRQSRLRLIWNNTTIAIQQSIASIKAFTASLSVASAKNLAGSAGGAVAGAGRAVKGAAAAGLAALGPVGVGLAIGTVVQEGLNFYFNRRTKAIQKEIDAINQYSDGLKKAREKIIEQANAIQVTANNRGVLSQIAGATKGEGETTEDYYSRLRSLGSEVGLTFSDDIEKFVSQFRALRKNIIEKLNEAGSQISTFSSQIEKDLLATQINSQKELFLLQQKRVSEQEIFLKLQSQSINSDNVEKANAESQLKILELQKKLSSDIVDTIIKGTDEGKLFDLKLIDENQAKGFKNAIFEVAKEASNLNMTSSQIKDEIFKAVEGYTNNKDILRSLNNLTEEQINNLVAQTQELIAQERQRKNIQLIQEATSRIDEIALDRLKAGLQVQKDYNRTILERSALSKQILSAQGEINLIQVKLQDVRLDPKTKRDLEIELSGLEISLKELQAEADFERSVRDSFTSFFEKYTLPEIIRKEDENRAKSIINKINGAASAFTSLLTDSEFVSELKSGSISAGQAFVDTVRSGLPEIFKSVTPTETSAPTINTTQSKRTSAQDPRTYLRQNIEYIDREIARLNNSVATATTATQPILIDPNNAEFRGVNPNNNQNILTNFRNNSIDFNPSPDINQVKKEIDSLKEERKGYQEKIKKYNESFSNSTPRSPEIPENPYIFGSSNPFPEPFYPPMNPGYTPDNLGTPKGLLTETQKVNVELKALAENEQLIKDYLEAGVEERQNIIRQIVEQSGLTGNLADRLFEIKSAELERAAFIKEQTLELTEQLRIQKEYEDSLKKMSGFERGFTRATDTLLGRNGQGESLDAFQERLAFEIPTSFANNLSQALVDASNGTKKLKDALIDVAKSFLSMIQQAFMQRAVNQIVGGTMNFFSPKASGGYISGGSGVRDDVPTMLMAGEYVIKKDAVSKYGVDFLSNLNQKAMPTMQQGGFFLPGMYGQGDIKGQKNVEQFAFQRVTSGANDKISSFKGGASIDLETQSRRLTNFGRTREDSPIVQQLLEEQGKAQDLLYQKQEYERQQKEQRKEALKQLAVQFGLTLATAGLSSLITSGVQTFQGRQTAKAAGLNWSELSPVEKDFYKNLGPMSGWTGVGTSGKANGGYPQSPSKAMVMGGEFIVGRQAVEQYGKNYFDSINNMTAPSPRFAMGGMVGAPQEQSSVSSGGDTNITINVSSENKSDTQTDNQNNEQGNRLAERIRKEVVRVIEEEKRVSGSLSSRKRGV